MRPSCSKSRRSPYGRILCRFVRLRSASALYFGYSKDQLTGDAYVMKDSKRMRPYPSKPIVCLNRRGVYQGKMS